MTDRLAEMERQVIENLPIKTLEHRNMYSRYSYLLETIVGIG